MAVHAAPTAGRSRWSRSYPPLALLAVAVVIAAFVLPSALNLPQSNPSTVLEYAPVPPTDEDTPPLQGNLSSLGLGSTGTLSLGGQPAPVSIAPKGTGQKPLVKQCVGDPPRQTEDPMSPPCVPFFEGDNFGATYQGVTKDEIRVVIYLDSGIYGGQQGFDGEPSPTANRLIDLNDAPKRPCGARDSNPNTCDHVLIRVARAMGVYFNNRFMTYDRTVHYWAYFTGASTEAARRADAHEIWTQLRPFAVLDQATFNGNNVAFVDTMAARNVLVFSSQEILPNDIYLRNAPLLWGFWPDVERWADIYTTYVCTRVAYSGAKALHTGNPQRSGPYYNQPRKFGVFYTTDPNRPGLRAFSDLVIRKLKATCVPDPVPATFSKAGFIVDGSDPGTDQQAAVTKLQQNNVTTVLWLGGVEGNFTKTAARQNYYPEIVVAGDLDLDNNGNGRLQERDVWRNAWATQLQIRIDRLEDTAGYRAFNEASPNETTDYAGRFARDAYRDHFNLFQGIQAAGPELHPETIEQGFRAFPEKVSRDPYTAAYYFDPGDYSGVKDSMEVWWDPDGKSEGATVESGGDSGCMRMVRGGQRFTAGKWPPADELVFVNDAARPAPCTAYGGGRQYRIS